MHFDKDELMAIRRYLDEKWPRPRICPVCQRKPDHWRVSETPVLLTLLTGTADISMHNFEQAVDSLAVAPEVALTCSYCGYTLLFSAAQIGVASVEAEAEAVARFSIPSE